MLVDLEKIFRSLLAFLYFGIFVAADVPRPRGVSLSLASLYAPSDTFTCLDGKLTIKYTQVNDDYCDCEDSSDEPGTSACPNGKFHCENTGHQSMVIPSSRVNDGVCDCCDASDEYASKAECTNNCDELGQEARQRQKVMADLLKRGSLIRSEMSTKGKALKEEQSSRLNTIQQSIDQADALKNEKEKIKEAAEKLESAALEMYKQIIDEEKQRKADLAAQENRAEAEEKFKLFDSNGDGVIEISEITTRVQFDSNRDGQVDEEEAKYFLDHHDQVDLETFVTLCWPRMKPYLMLDAGLFKPPAKTEEVEAKHEETIREEEAHEDGEIAELQNEEDAETFDEEETGEGEVEQVEAPSGDPEYDEETKRLIEEATKARSDFEAAQRELRDLEAEKRQIDELLNKDYGPHEEFAILNGECFEYEDREYIYRLCPFDRAVQKPKDGGETRLGGWDRWDGKPNKYSTMLYSNGAGCWNGPQRSTIVELDCGLDNRVTAVSEPNRCEYLFKFETPAACIHSPHVDSDAATGHDEL
ncbi:glucosidase 2 subunit beta [Sitodiplosis mosellana]|uniref:glucosidase 2 subunit beta n=1 Tax=Sitodiplosis mosellana TaxID=263140 RepID=UPI0024448B85|nr:glucosidase 2 subunit beta [Sitodiplosis mosellana]